MPTVAQFVNGGNGAEPLAVAVIVIVPTTPLGIRPAGVCALQFS